MDAIEVREHEMLAEDMARTCAQYLSTSREENSLEHRAKIYHSPVLCGKIRLSVIWITDRENGGLFQPQDTCPNTG